MISNRTRTQLFTLLLCVIFVLSLSAWADDDDPPSRVARMSYAQGSVSFQPGGEGDWVSAVPNRPLTSGDNLWTERGARAELHVGSTAIRLDGETSLTFLELDDRAIQLRLPQGSMILNVRHLDDDEAVEVDTPNLAFTIESNGQYRVDVDPDGKQTLVSVFHGRGKATGGGYDYTVVAGQQARFVGDDDLNYDIDSIPDYDDFANWAFDRDHREDRANSANYVSREMTGYEDLDDYGRWSYAGNYGPVWVPSGVPEGWAPYRYGHWVWVAPWGWTWVDDEPWGFAPFHYGRWCQIGGGWAWVPGPVVVRPVYAPALVAFVGGGGFHFSIGVGAVAWFPLGPGEVFVPGYHVSQRYVTNVNITNTRVDVVRVTNVYNSYTVNNRTNVTNITYVNQHVQNGVTSVSHETFINARPVARNIVTVPQRELEQAPVTHMVDVQPQRASVIGAGRPTSSAPPAAIANRRVVAQRTPAQPVIPFNQRTNPWQARPVQSQIRMAEPAKQAPPREANQPAHTETPVARTPQPADNSRNESWRSNRPGQPVNQPAPAATQARPEQGNQPRENTSRADAEQSQGAQRRADQNWTHPLAKPAPPERPKTEPQMREDESKFKRWEQQQKPESRPPAQQRSEKPEPKKDEKKDHK
jgi:hypothetical protein